MNRRRVLALRASLAMLRALAPLGGLAAQGLPDDSVFSAVLRVHVRGGRVDYAALQDDSARLRSYLDALAATAPAAVAQADGQTRLAFWISAMPVALATSALAKPDAFVAEAEPAASVSSWNFFALARVSTR